MSSSLDDDAAPRTAIVAATPTTTVAVTSCGEAECVDALRHAVRRERQALAVGEASRTLCVTEATRRSRHDTRRMHDQPSMRARMALDASAESRGALACAATTLGGIGTMLRLSASLALRFFNIRVMLASAIVDAI